VERARSAGILPARDSATVEPTEPGRDRCQPSRVPIRHGAATRSWPLHETRPTVADPQHLGPGPRRPSVPRDRPRFTRGGDPLGLL